MQMDTRTYIILVITITARMEESKIVYTEYFLNELKKFNNT